MMQDLRRKDSRTVVVDSSSDSESGEERKRGRSKRSVKICDSEDSDSDESQKGVKLVHFCGRFCPAL